MSTSFFRKFPNSIACCGRISPVEKSLLLCISAHVDFGTGEGRVSNSTLRAECSPNVNTLANAKARLVQLGLLEILEKGQRCQTTTKYRCPWLVTGTWVEPVNLPEVPAKVKKRPVFTPVEEPVVAANTARKFKPVWRDRSAPAPRAAAKPDASRSRGERNTDLALPGRATELSRAERIDNATKALEAASLVGSMKSVMLMEAQELHAARLRKAYKDHKLHGTPLPPELVNFAD